MCTYSCWSQEVIPFNIQVSLGLQACLQVGRLKDEGKDAPEMISLIKRNSCGKALEAARLARDMLGGEAHEEIDRVVTHCILVLIPPPPPVTVYARVIN